MSHNNPIAALYGNLAPFAKPSWYGALASPYYKESHRRLRDYVRNYVQEHIVPNVQKWEEDGLVPDEAKLHFARSGLAFPQMPTEYVGGAQSPGGVSANEWDVFHSLVMNYELSKVWAAGVSAGLSGGNAIGLPPIIHHGTKEQRRRWL